MSGVNHIVGGLVFTGIFASFWNINIFSRVAYTALTLIGSTFPDIDHPKSPLGRLLFPFSRYIDRKFGHRTLTHSLATLLALTISCYALEKTLSTSHPYTVILFFSLTSHLLLDMMTKQGIQLLYPFSNTPCVIPGNPDLRFKSGDFKTEAFLLILFLMIGSSCLSLFQHGFWTSFNRSFGTLRHLNREFMASTKLLHLTYDYHHLGQHYTGEGWVAHTAPSQAVLFQHNQFHTIPAGAHIQKLLPTRTNHHYIVTEDPIQNLSKEEVLQLIDNRPILALHLTANAPISYQKQGKHYKSQQVDLQYVYNPILHFHAEELQKEQQAARKKLQQNLQKAQQQHKERQQRLQTLQQHIQQLTQSANQATPYHREHLTQQVKQARKEIQTLNKPIGPSITHLQATIQHLQQQPPPPILCNGYIKVLQIPNKQT